MKFIKCNTFLAGLLCTAFQVQAAPAGIADPLADTAYFNQTQTGFDLHFNDRHYRLLETQVNGKVIHFRAYEKIVYVQHPLEPDYQTLNFYVPEAYFNGKTVNGFSAQTAPIFLPNAVGGYMPAKAATYDQKSMGDSSKPNAIVTALAKGYVVASVGARGRTLEQNGKYTGKAPAAIVDLKSAVRYLHFNDRNMAGDANKIISNGTSAGGALSALLGASGNHPDYAPYFKQLGAANASDRIFAVSAYCPITNLEHADMAYEWEFNGLNQFSRMDMSQLNAATFNDRSKSMPKIEGELSAEQIRISHQLKSDFLNYLNRLKLKDENGKPLTLNADGSGSFHDYLKNIILQSAQRSYRQGEDLSGYTWLKLGKNGVTDLDWHGYIHSAKRMKSPPAFDGLDLSNGENNLFGSETVNNRHFTAYSLAHSTQKGAAIAPPDIIKMMNAMNYVNNPDAARHWRIRVGTADRDTSHAIATILAVKLQMSGKRVDYQMPWNVPHSGDYDLEELFNWADSISK
ncbi:subtype B tannase [Bisgaard Taxon 10/6]|nr:subtype B tannase [Exercitatus varius]MDG2941736.1 subtype B tannase [Exercitatus varius]